MFSESSAFHVLTPDPAPAPDLAEFLWSSLEWQNDVLPSWCPAQVEALDIKTMARMKGRFAESPNLQVSNHGYFSNFCVTFHGFTLRPY